MAKHNVDFTAGKPIHMPEALRAEIAAAIQAHLTAVEKLTAVLDKADGDPDSEPSLGYQPYGRSEVDLEGHDVQDEPHDEQDEGDKEPSLAHSNDFNQTRSMRPGADWQTGMDLEDQYNG